MTRHVAMVALESLALVCTAVGCSNQGPRFGEIACPEDYIYLDGGNEWGWGLTLRVVDWGGSAV
ncbi:MAG: hypothetical protein ACYSVY_14000, partial [Planctomycetota bacterium]